jgi:c(7)-type cytochrome triheme protein
MKTLAAFLLILSLLVTLSAIAADAPDKIEFESKMGNVTFDHKAHTERAKEDCTVCHDKLFPQSREPINFKAGMHKPAEADKTSCAGCHHAGGAAFETKGNCKNCHVK